MDGNGVIASIYSAIQTRILAEFGDGLIPVQSGGQGGFGYYYLNSSGQFNQWAYAVVSPMVLAGAYPGTAQLSTGGSFPFGYLRLLTQIAFQLSPEDQQTLTDAQNNSVQQATSVIQEWTGAFGPITATQLQKAAAVLGFSPKALDYVIGYQIGSVWSGSNPPLTYSQLSQASNLQDLLPRMPANGAPLVSAVTSYISAAKPALPVTDRQNQGNWMLYQMRTNLYSQNLANGPGGMETFDPSGLMANQWVPGYVLGKSIQQIVQDLSRPVAMTVSIEVTMTATSQYTVSINGGPPLPFSGSLLGSSSAGGALFADDSPQTLTLTYQGFSLVPLTPRTWSPSASDAATPSMGWYAPAIIAEAAANYQASNPPSGFVFVSQPPFNLGPLPSGQFNLLSSVLIANYPTLSLKQFASVAGVSNLYALRSPGTVPALKLFGEIPIGRVIEGSPGFKASFRTAAPGVPTYQQTAYVIAGAVQTPGVASATKT